MPKQYTTTFRGDLTDIASIARWMVKQGQVPTSRNQLITCAVSNFVDYLRADFPDDVITNDEDAERYLLEIGLSGRAKVPLPKARMSQASTNPHIKSEPAVSQHVATANVGSISENLAELVKKNLKRQEADQATQTALDNVGGAPVVKDN